MLHAFHIIYKLKHLKMRFWFGLVLSLFGGLVGIGLFREWIKLKLSVLDDSTLDVVSLIELII
jgi:hypothetical protein